MAKISHLAFENFEERSPTILWRVVSLRPFKSKHVRCVDYFASEEDAWKSAGLAIECGYEDISVSAFELRQIEGSAASTLKEKEKDQ